MDGSFPAAEERSEDMLTEGVCMLGLSGKRCGIRRRSILRFRPEGKRHDAFPAFEKTVRKLEDQSVFGQELFRKGDKISVPEPAEKERPGDHAGQIT